VAEARPVSPLAAQYDEEQDILYLLLTHQAEAAVAEEVADEVYVRYETASRRIVDVEFLSFRARLEEAFGPDLTFSGTLTPERLLPLGRDARLPVSLREPDSDYDPDAGVDR
jgi:uncharacterized protein YuzE